MRSSDWSSDVCSSHLGANAGNQIRQRLVVSDIFAVNSDNDVTGPDARICCRPSRLDRLNKLTAVVRNAKRICEILANRLDAHTQVAALYCRAGLPFFPDGSGHLGRTGKNDADASAGPT